MPCSDGRDSCYNYEADNLRDNIRELKKKLQQKQEWVDEYARMLCRQCKIIEGLKPKLEHLVTNHVIENIFDPAIKEWWEKHKIEDAAREKAEKEKKDKENKIKLEQYLKLKQELDL